MGFDELFVNTRCKLTSCRLTNLALSLESPRIIWFCALSIKGSFFETPGIFFSTHKHEFQNSSVLQESPVF